MSSISKNERKLIVAIIIAGTFISALTQTVLTSGLPHIMRDFNVDATLGQWLTTAYLLVLGVTIPVTAYLTNRFKTRTLFILSMSLYLTGCIISIFASNFHMLIASRIIQAVGSGVLTQLAQIILLGLYPVEERGSAMGTYGLAIGVAPAIGPTLSGYVIDNFGWRDMFGILAVLAGIVIIVGAIKLINVGETKRSKLDIISITLSTLGFGGLLVGVSNEGTYGWGNTVTFVPLILGVLALVMFVIRQLKLEKPLLELRVFKTKNYVVSIILICILYAAMMSATIILSIYIQSVRGYSATESGLIMLPGSILFGILSPVTGKILDKYGPRLLCIFGMTIFCLGNFYFSILTVNSPIYLVAIMYACRMIGISSILLNITTWGLNSLKKEEVSHGAVINNTLRQSAGAIGSAVLVTIMASGAKRATLTPLEATTYGVASSFVTATILSAIGLVIIILFMKNNKVNDRKSESKVA